MPEQKINCPICNEKAKIDNLENSLKEIKCPICGYVIIEHDLQSFLELNENEKAILKTYYYRLNLNNNYQDNKLDMALTKSNKNAFIQKIMAPKNIIEKINYVIKYIADNTKFYGSTVEIEPLNGHRLFFCRDEEELDNILLDIANRGYITKNSVKVSTIKVIDHKKPPRRIVMTSEGLKYAETLQNRIDSQQCFVAMWFNNETEQLYEKIKLAVTGTPNVDKTSPQYGASYQIMKIDNKEHVNYIPSEIISEIKRSRFMITDLTGYRGGVYYEAGYAEGLGIPVILTCSEDWFEDQKDADGNITRNGVHFDLRQKNILFWNNDNLEQFQRNLVARIGEVVGFYT